MAIVRAGGHNPHHLARRLGHVTPRIAVVLLAGMLLAGCSGGSPGKPKKDDLPTLVATKDTGVIRALAVDEAIRPLKGVLIVLQGGGNKTTNGDGFAGFEGLPPGTYVVEAHLLGYSAQTQSVDVAAGVDDPPIVKFQLTRAVGDIPFYVQVPYEGYMQCGLKGPAFSANVCFIADYYPCFALRTGGQSCPSNLTSDNSYKSLPFVLDYPRPPTYLQVELVWESTQTLAPDMQMRVDLVNLTDESIDYANSTAGVSPLMVSLNATEMLGFATNDGVNDVTITVGQTHIPALEVFTSGQYVGATFQQKITYYVTAFYGYTPPPDWRFANGDPVPQPPY